MKSKKLILNVLAVFSVVIMTAVMVLSSCGNAADSEYANITIRLSGSGYGRAISNEEKAASTFNVYFNDSLVASNVKGTYHGKAQVGTSLNIRVDAIVNSKRIARGENTITVKSPSNDVDVRLSENREHGSGELKGIPQIGSIIMNDGTLRTSADIGNDTANAIAVVYKVVGGKAWAVGKSSSPSMIAWADTSANGYNENITALQEGNGYADGSTGLGILIAAASDAATDLENMYHAWDYACNYGTKQGLTSFQTGWYLPSKQELQEVRDQKDNLPSALLNFRSNYWSSSQFLGIGSYAFTLTFGSDSWGTQTKNKGYYVCAVRQFTW